jgi:hypothetical protein
MKPPLRKPPHGAPCNRCGLCCKAIVCPFGAVLFKRQQGPCPALEETATGFACGVIVHPMEYARAQTLIHGAETMRQAALLLIGAGDGCDMVVDGEPADRAFEERMIEAAKKARAASKAARKLWGVDRER